MSSGRIKTHAAFLLKVLKNKSIIDKASNKQIGLLVEIIYNILNNNCVLLSNKEKGALHGKVVILEEISKIRDPESARRKLSGLNKTVLKCLIRPVLALNGL